MTYSDFPPERSTSIVVGCQTCSIVRSTSSSSGADILVRNSLRCTVDLVPDHLFGESHGILLDQIVLITQLLDDGRPVGIRLLENDVYVDNLVFFFVGTIEGHLDLP